MRQICCHIPDAPLKLFSIVDPFAEHDLSVHRNPALIEFLHLLQRLPRKPVMQHLAAQFRVGRVKGNIDRLQMILYDPPNVMITHIRQCNIVSLQERESGIIILKIQRLPHSLRHLVDKAEHTLVSAGTVLIHQSLFKLDPQIFFIILLDLQLPLFSVRFLDQKNQFLIIYKVMIIKDILDLLVIDTDQAVPRFHSELPRDTSVLHRTDDMSIFHIVFS